MVRSRRRSWSPGSSAPTERMRRRDRNGAEMIRWFACFTSFLDTFLFCWGLTYVQRYMYIHKLIHVLYIYIYILYVPLHSFILLGMTFTLYNICQKKWFIYQHDHCPHLGWSQFTPPKKNQAWNRQMCISNLIDIYIYICICTCICICIDIGNHSAKSLTK